MTLDVSFQYGIIVSKAHLPIMNNVVIDGINFWLVGVNIKRLYAGIHKDWIFLEIFFYV